MKILLQEAGGGRRVTDLQIIPTGLMVNLIIMIIKRIVGKKTLRELENGMTTFVTSQQPMHCVKLSNK